MDAAEVPPADVAARLRWMAEGPKPPGNSNTVADWVGSFTWGELFSAIAEYWSIDAGEFFFKADEDDQRTHLCILAELIEQ